MVCKTHWVTVKWIINSPDIGNYEKKVKEFVLFYFGYSDSIIVIDYNSNELDS